MTDVDLTGRTPIRVTIKSESIAPPLVSININEAEIQRVDERHGGFHRAGLGEFGEHLQTEYKRIAPKHPYPKFRLLFFQP